ncbi:MAG: AsmA-like C-terminal region-containing protein [Chitinophagales bacterium]|nr:AsmA-like C-terminal region-containing protein [Chitinophagales bacterium]
MLRKIFIAFAIILVLLFGALIALPFLFKDKLAAIAKKEINQQINATVDWKSVGVSIFSDFPNITLSLKEFSIVNKAPFAGDTLAKLAAFSVSADIMSVIKGDVVDIKGISIEKPIIKVKVLKDGTANYDIALPDTAKKAPDTTSGSFNLKLQQFSISDAFISYDDKASDLYAELDQFNNMLKGDFTQSRFMLDTKTTCEKTTVVSAGVAYLNKVKADLKLDLDIDQANSKYTLKDNTIQLNDLKLSLNGFVTMAKPEAIDMDLQFKAAQTEFKSILSLVPGIYTQQFSDVKTSGTLALNGYAKGTYAGESYPAFGIDLKVGNASFQYPGLPASVTDINIDLNAKHPGGDLNKMVIDVPKCAMKLGGDPFNLRLNVQTPIVDPLIDAALIGKVNLANVKNYYPLQQGESLSGLLDMNVTAKGKLSAIEQERYGDFQAAGNIAVSGMVYQSKDLPQKVNLQSLKLSFTPQYVSLDNLVATLGKSDFNAQGRMDNFLNYLFAGDMLKGSFSLKCNTLDLNEFMTEETSTKTQQTTTAQGTKTSTESTAMQVPANINFSMDASIAKLLYDNVVMNTVAGKINIKDETVQLEYLKGRVFNGTIAFNGTYSTFMTEVPKVNMQVAIDKLSIPDAVKAFSTTEKILPLAKQMKGTFSTTFDMKGNLNEDLSPDLNSLLANGRVDLMEIELSGNKVMNKLADQFKIPQLKTLKVPNAWTVVELIDGKIFVKPFDVMVNGMKMNIFGSHSLTNSMDYTMLMDVPSQLLGPANSLVSGLLSKSPIPGVSAANLPQNMKFKVGLTGKTDDPKIAINLVSGSGSTAKDLAQQQVDAAKQKLEEEAAKAKAEAERLKNEAEAKAKAELEKQKKAAEEKAKKEAERLKKEAEEKAKKEAEKALKDKLKWPR